ncbi:hypothetical protein JCM5350_006803 [Sporobolomyces pararoseus]
MGMRSIPPELLRHILSQLNNFPCSSSEAEYKERNENLKNCSLVSRTWRSIAQDLLPDELWISPQDQLAKERLEIFARHLQREPFKNGKTRKLVVRRTMLMIEDDLLQRADGTIDQRWKSANYLQLSVAIASVLSLSYFPHLTKLFLNQVDLYLRNSGGVIFPSLTDLALNNVEIYDDLSLARTIFSPTAMPQLVHLALRCRHHTFPLKDVFVNLLPQITSLALDQLPHRARGAVWDHFFESCPRNGMLKHLSIVYNLYRAQDLLPENGPRLNLDTLHIQCWFGTDFRGDFDRQIDFETEYLRYLKRKEKVGARTLVLCSCDVGILPAFPERDDVVWKKQHKPPFEGFDGSF